MLSALLCLDSENASKVEICWTIAKNLLLEISILGASLSNRGLQGLCSIGSTGIGHSILSCLKNFKLQLIRAIASFQVFWKIIIWIDVSRPITQAHNIAGYHRVNLTHLWFSIIRSHWVYILAIIEWPSLDYIQYIFLTVLFSSYYL